MSSATDTDIQVTIPDDAWRDIGEKPTERLLANVTINGVPFHVNAFSVYVDDGSHGEQRAFDGDEDLAMIHAALGADGHWSTVSIRGVDGHERDYVLILEPYC